MGVLVTNIEFDSADFNVINPATRHLWGNTFYKMYLTIDFEVHTYAIATADQSITFGEVGYPDTTYIVDNFNAGLFADFKSGDTIIVQNTTSNNGTYTNIVKINDYVIRVNSPLTLEGSTVGEIYLMKTYTSVEYLYNLVENSDPATFESKIDSSTQKFVANNISTSFVPMSPQGYKSWYLGDVEIKRTSVSATYKNVFQLVQTIYITPLFLKEQTLDTFPDYFLNNNCLRHVFQINAKPTATDNTRVQSILFDSEQGNTGWFDENYNTGVTNYSISNLTYTRVSDSATLQGVQLSDTEVTEVQFDIDNTTDTPFASSPATILVANFINVPFNDSDYKQTSTELDYNFSFDRVKNFVGIAPQDGDFGRAIKDFEITFVNSGKVTVNFKIDFDTDTYNRIVSMDEAKYLLAISVQDRTLSPDVSDGVTLAISYDDYFVDLGLEDAVVVDEEVYIEHPFQNKIDGVTTLDSFLEDEIVGYKRFKIDTSLASDTFTISEVRAGIKSSDSTNSFKLSEYKLNTQNSSIVNGFDYIDSSQTIPFKAPSSELVTKFSLKRDIASDASPLYYFDLYFGWINRWEYWLKNTDINSDFFDIAEPNNGLNDNWERYDSLGYSLYFFVEFDLTIDGQTQTLVFDSPFTVNDYNSNADWDNEDIKTYDSDSNQLINGADEYILGYERTKVVSEFEWVGAGTAPLTTEVDIIMRLEGYEVGGQFNSTRFTSARSSTTNTQWVSIDLSNKVVITSAGNILYGTAEIDNFALQNFSEYSITARIYDKRNLENCLLKENGDEIYQENNDCILTEL